MATVITRDAPVAATAGRKPFYLTLWGQVLLGVAIAIVLGYVRPATAQAMRPLGDAFIRLITMVIPLVIFCTVAAGIAGMDSIKKVGRVGGKALLYFEILTSIALLLGLLVGAFTQPGAGFNATPTAGDATAVAGYAGQAKAQTVTDFLMNIIPTSVVGAFAGGSILNVILVSLLIGFALASLGPKAKPVTDVLEGLTQMIFRVVNILMRLAPIGAFGAMAFTVGRYGVSSLGPLAKLIVTLWVTSALFVLIVLGAVSAMAGFNIIRFLKYIREEIVLTLSLSSSDPALPSLMRKLENLGCSKALVGLVTPTGYIFNPDGSCIYMALAAVFVAQATNVPLTFANYVTLFAVAALTHKGAVGIQGAAFIALVATLMVIPSIPVAGMALILGLDRFMSMCRATVNMLCNGVATLVLSRWEHELDGETLRKNLAALT
ncbi:MAG TPA: C4-dicarboxylate transporter DctA [Vicinamibacterales bacterium]|jgi:aerobic C4-dicarboxylate transport protein|nr:C4-dicarboxylate transporter DctA [Vicinamibacterales bacterium]